MRMPDEHSPFRGVKKSIVGICAAVVICFAGRTHATTCCRYYEGPWRDIDAEVAQLCDHVPPPSEQTARIARHSLCVNHRMATASHQARIGMTSEMAREMWGTPDHINASVIANGLTEEQWVYPSDQYLYFRDRTLISFQTNGVKVALADDQVTMYQKGLSDRAAWEAWFNSLEGDFKTGAFYWSSQRSLSQPGSCRQMSAEFTAGCTAAKSRLDPSDALRRSQPDYKLGWNAWAPSVPDTRQPPSTPVVSTAPSALPPTAEPTVTVPSTNATAAPKSDDKPRQTPSGIPVEEEALLVSDSRDALDAIDAMAHVVKANGYRCSSISGFSAYVFSRGFKLTCNRFAYSYEFEDKGRGLEFRPPR
jgi:hypothetical protein